LTDCATSVPDLFPSWTFSINDLIVALISLFLAHAISLPKFALSRPLQPANGLRDLLERSKNGDELSLKPLPIHLV
jgi:hypothetical protein